MKEVKHIKRDLQEVFRANKCTTCRDTCVQQFQNAIKEMQEQVRDLWEALPPNICDELSELGIKIREVMTCTRLDEKKL